MMHVTKNIKRYGKKQEGFTLIELCLVLAIISMLASIAIPSYQSLSGKAFDVRAKSDVANVAKASSSMINLGEGGAFALDGDIVKCDTDDRLFVLSDGVAGTVEGFSGTDAADSWLLVQLSHGRGTKTYTYTFNGATGENDFTET